MLEHIILGAIQGVTEWVPVSSKACVIAAKIYFFKDTGTLNELINYALFLHLGTFFAAAVYFWADIKNVLKAIFSPKEDNVEGKKIFVFLLITTALTALGQILINNVSAIAYSAPKAKAAITCIIAALLIVAGFLQHPMAPKLHIRRQRILLVLGLGNQRQARQGDAVDRLD